MSATLDRFVEAAARMFEPPERKWATPGDLARALDPMTAQTPALDLIDAELVRVADSKDERVIITMAPQEGKSRRVARDFVLWWLSQLPDARVVVASYGQDLATRNGYEIRAAVEAGLIGETIAPDHGAASNWKLAGKRGGVYAVGIGGGLGGRPCDLMIIDDPIKDQAEADSEAFRERVWNWWETVATARLAPGASVVVILTRWHEDDLAGKLLKQPDGLWRVINIPAQADHDPNKGETDILGRQPGEFMASAQRRSLAQWLMRQREAGSRAWQALYQGNPSTPGGTMFRSAAWGEYKVPLWLDRPDGSKIIIGLERENAELIQSWDMTFKDSTGTDFVVGQVWYRLDLNVFLLDQVRERMDFPETCRRLVALSAKWPQALLKVVEDKANGPAVIAQLRNTVPGLVPEEPQGGKVARANAVMPVIESGNVFLPSPELAPWIGDLIEEAKSFPTGTHDDQVDALTQAINRLIVQPLIQMPPDEDQYQPTAPAWAMPSF